MINSTNNIHIDGNPIDHDEFMKTFKFNSDDKFSRWVLRPLAVLAALGVGAAAFFASAILLLLSLATLPLLALAMWAVKYKLEREQAANDPVVHTQDPA